MSPSAGRPPPRSSTGDPTRAGTPAATRPLLTRAELRSYLDGETGSVRSADNARHWLDTKGWILAAEPYECTKLVRVLLTAALSKGSEIKGDVRNAILSVAYLLEENVEDALSDSLADKITDKVVQCVEHATQRLASAADFANATDTSRAEATLALKTVADQLLVVSSNLDKITGKLATAPQSSPPPSQPSWAAIVKSNSPQSAEHPGLHDLRSRSLSTTDQGATACPPPDQDRHHGSR
ncbi:hypothetical protein H0H92_003668 [Tricholoma furcatifolium]|nr:hypothetical protein H0H92_003668 [Tricholoma furcatifolium]